MLLYERNDSSSVGELYCHRVARCVPRRTMRGASWARWKIRASLGVGLKIDGERISIDGPARGVACAKPDIAANKSRVLTYLLAREKGACALSTASPPAGETAHRAGTKRKRKPAATHASNVAEGEQARKA